MDEITHKNYLDQITVNIISYLEKKTGVCQVSNDIKPPAERPAVLMWEQKQSLLLPEDLKNFFLTCNGFHLTWSVKMESNIIPVGCMHICSVNQLLPLDPVLDDGTHLAPSLWDLDMEKERNGKKSPSFVTSKIFQLDHCQGHGKVCLVYNDNGSQVDEDEKSDLDIHNDFKLPSDYTTEIWFLDRSLCWHFLCSTFQAYYRLMLMHLGLPHWQLAITDIGLPPTSQQWFNLYAPVRLEVDVEGDISSNSLSSEVISSPLDVNKVFKSKSTTKKPTAAHNTASGTVVSKRKPPVSSARSATGAGKLIASSVSQSNVRTK